MKAAEQLGYTPNALARSLITQRSDLVGVVIARYTLRANPDVIHAIGESLSSAAGKRVMLVTVESDYPAFDDLRGVLEYPLEGLVSCVLLAPSDLEELRRRRVPVVFYNRDPGKRGGGLRRRQSFRRVRQPRHAPASRPGTGTSFASAARATPS